MLRINLCSRSNTNLQLFILLVALLEMHKNIYNSNYKNTNYATDNRPGFEFRLGQSKSLPALRPTQSPIHWVWELFSGGKAAGA
jgi:hypothetical protein